AYAEMEDGGGFATAVTPELAAFIGERDSFYLATASADGQPYVQHRGGPKGFLRVLGATTLAFADFRGNRQYLTTGNLADNPKAFIFLMDYAERRRIKIWGQARVVRDDPALIDALMPAGRRAKPEQAIVFEVTAWSTNCPQHIPVKIDAADVAPVIEQLQTQIAALQAENAALKQGA
ncbi:MAG TPA: pyridoxamine 5'-phosphate oxidase family protein, partial [Caulobacteraceae bacterium]|nr:pyridoxamine 5'-phosphate oxidase family protein [Caulobacteraceae bacterium]